MYTWIWSLSFPLVISRPRTHPQRHFSSFPLALWVSSHLSILCTSSNKEIWRVHSTYITYTVSHVHSFAAHLTVNEGPRVSAVAPWLLAFYIEVEPAQSLFSDEKEMSNCQTFQCGWQLMQCNGIPCVVTVCLACLSQVSRSNVPSSSGEDIEMERKRHPVRNTRNNIIS